MAADEALDLLVNPADVLKGDVTKWTSVVRLGQVAAGLRSQAVEIEQSISDLAAEPWVLPSGLAVRVEPRPLVLPYIEVRPATAGPGRDFWNGVEPGRE